MGSPALRPMRPLVLLILAVGLLMPAALLATAVLVDAETDMPELYRLVSAPILEGEGDGETLLIDDFAIRPVSLEAWHAVATDGRTRADFTVTASGDRHCLEADFFRPDPAEAADVAGLVVRVAGGLGRDVSAFGAVRLRVRGAPGTYIVQLGSARVEDHDHFNAYIQLDGSEQEIIVPIDSFRQEGYGEPVAWTGRDVVHLGLFSLVPGTTTVELSELRLTP